MHQTLRYCQYTNDISRKTLIKGPTIPAILQTWQWLRHPVDFLRNCESNLGSVFSIDLLGDHFIVISEPQIAERLLLCDSDIAHANKADRFFSILGPSSILLISGQRHLEIRRLVTSGLTTHKVMKYDSDIISRTDQMINKWKPGNIVHLFRDMQDLTLDIILQIVFGDNDPITTNQLKKFFSTSLHLLGRPEALAPVYIQEYFPSIAPWPRVMLMLRDLDSLIYSMIRKHRAEKAKFRRAKLSILSHLVDTANIPGPGLSDAEIRDQLITLIVAGRDTTATALSWALDFLLLHPELWSRLSTEVRAAEFDGKLIPIQVQNLSLLNAIVCETLRLQPGFLLITRQLQQEISLFGHTLPRGIEVAPSMYLAHRNHQTFAEPDIFRPERFLERRPMLGEWFPFGGGIRRCAGINAAFLIMKLILASIVNRTTLRPLSMKPANPVRKLVTLAPDTGVPARVISRLSTRS